MADRDWFSFGGECHHIGRLALADLPDWDWCDIGAHLKCSVCDSVGYGDTRLDWSKIYDFSKANSY
jgi:hypothetical protein